MDCAELEASLKCYNEQLSEVEEALVINGNNNDLISLKADLNELISITEDALLNLKKNQLLDALHKDGESDVESTTGVTGDSIGISPTSCPSAPLEEEENLENFIGMKCSVPYRTAFGTTQQQNCVVMSVHVSDEEHVPSTVTVAFLTPSAMNMLPCKHYFRGTCNFTPCRYSHGYSVSVDEISDYMEPHFGDFNHGKRCLGKGNDDLWLPATVTGIKDDFLLVMFDGRNIEEKLSYEDVFPLLSVESSSDIEDDIRIELLEPQTYTTCLTSNNFGAWEEHTNSFGSRMLIKMGYIPGQGLGPTGSGRLDPVEADVIPSGVSLDFVKDLRKKSLIRTVSKLNTILKKRANRKLSKKNIRIQKSESMFEMLDGIMTHSRSLKQKRSPEKVKKPINKVSDKSVRLKSISIENDIKISKKKISDLQKSLSRNKNDPSVCNRARDAIKAESAKLDGLYSKLNAVDTELKNRSNKAKLKIF